MILCLLLLCYIHGLVQGAGLISPKDIIDTSKPDVETVLTEEDFRSFTTHGDITKLGIKVKDDPTMGNKMEGDIAIDNLKKFVDDSNKLGRNAIRQAYRRWPNGEIPYTLSSQYGSYSRSVIAKAMQEYHDKTCVRFVPRDARRHVDYIFIHPDDGCYSLVGKTGGRQPLSLDSGCIQVGTIVHELMHAVGFFHEQSRYDRDDYIEIVWRNVQNGADDQFENGSGKKTIVPRKGGAERMGQRIAFSEGDLRKINKLYQCSSNISGNSIIEKNQNSEQLTSTATTYTSMIYGNYGRRPGRIRIFG
ncbi:hypothetical protein Aduo_007999 [Ancylostoma duodenale]